MSARLARGRLGVLVLLEGEVETDPLGHIAEAEDASHDLPPDDLRTGVALDHAPVLEGEHVEVAVPIAAEPGL